MPTRRMLLAATVAATVVACAGLKSANIQVNPGSDGGLLPDGAPADPEGGSIGLYPPDAGPPPLDFECPHDEWTKATKTKAECSARQVIAIDDTIISPNGVSIAKTPAGRIGISYNSEEFAETGKLHVAHFKSDKAGSTTPKVVIRDAPENFHDGYYSRIIGTAPDRLNVLSYDMSDLDQSATLRLAHLDNGTTLISDPDQVLEGGSGNSEIAFAIGSDGTAYASARVPFAPADDTHQKIVVRAQSPGSPWSSLPALPDTGTGLLPKNLPGIGATSLLVDPNGALHLLYQYNVDATASAPRYFAISGADWNFRKTVGNQQLSGFAGFNPRLAMFGTKKYALYFNHPGGQSGLPVADLRLATWINDENDTPTIEIIEQNITDDDLAQPRYRAAMAIDKYGLVHIAIVFPMDDADGYLEYKRQTRSDSGETKWLTDVIDDQVLAEDQFSNVDIYVDENARPHIAYTSAVDAKVHYATRYDR